MAAKPVSIASSTQFALLAVEGLALLAEADPAVVRQFQRQRGNLEVLLGQQLPCLGALLQQGTHLRDHGGIVGGAGQFGEQIHVPQFTVSAPSTLPISFACEIET
jgi:hypothetical protein